MPTENQRGAEAAARRGAGSQSRWIPGRPLEGETQVCSTPSPLPCGSHGRGRRTPHRPAAVSPSCPSPKWARWVSAWESEAGGGATGRGAQLAGPRGGWTRRGKAKGGQAPAPGPPPGPYGWLPAPCAPRSGLGHRPRGGELRGPAQESSPAAPSPHPSLSHSKTRPGPPSAPGWQACPCGHGRRPAQSRIAAAGGGDPRRCAAGPWPGCCGARPQSQAGIPQAPRSCTPRPAPGEVGG